MSGSGPLQPPGQNPRKNGKNTSQPVSQSQASVTCVYPGLVRLASALRPTVRTPQNGSPTFLGHCWDADASDLVGSSSCGYPHRRHSRLLVRRTWPFLMVFFSLAPGSPVPVAIVRPHTIASLGRSQKFIPSPWSPCTSQKHLQGPKMHRNVPQQQKLRRIACTACKRPNLCKTAE